MLAVIVGAVRLLAVGAVLTLLDLQEVRMVFLLFPAVRVGTLVLMCAPFRVRADEIVDLPVGTHFAIVLED